MDMKRSDKDIMVREGPEGVEIRIDRTFKTSVETLYRMWTEAELFQNWFGPHGYELPVCELDVRPGGKGRFCHRAPNGEEAWVSIVYHEVRPPSRLVMGFDIVDLEGRLREMDGVLVQTIVEVTFEEVNGETHLQIRQTGLVKDRGESIGWREVMERLAGLLAESEGE